MPRVPDASSVTTVRRVNATAPADPIIKSRTFVAPIKQGFLISVLRATDEGRSMDPTKTVLALPEWKSPRFNGRFFVN